MEEIKIKKDSIFVPLISAILIVIIGSLDVNWYFKNVCFPFLALLLCSIILVMDDKDVNKNAYFMLIPIILILISNVILGFFDCEIAQVNMILNLIVLPILISTFLFLLTNKNYVVSLKNISFMFKLFPQHIFKNFKYLKIRSVSGKMGNVLKVIAGITIGLVFSVVIILLLSSADDYFSEFMDKILFSFDFNLGNIIKFVIYFIILFSIGINLLRNRNLKMKETKYKFIDNTIVISMLSVVNFVFVLFLISEVSKLCGNFLQIPDGYIYSSYAREGFFQLLFVTLINFSIILYLMYKTKNIEKSKVTKNLVLLLVIFSAFLIFNSYYRMFLYIERFGFTILRLQVILFLAMELILFMLIAKKILKGLNHDGIKFLMVMTTFYVLNLYVCNDWFIGLVNKLWISM